MCALPAFDLEYFVNREKELAYITEKVARLARGDPFAPHERVTHFIGPSGIGKSWLLEKCYVIVDNMPKCIPILLTLKTFRNGDENFVEDILANVDKNFSVYLGIPAGHRNRSLQAFGSDILKKINVRMQDQVLVLFLDEINVPEIGELHAIEETLLQDLLHGNERVILITAGRSYPMLNDFALRPNTTNTFLLSAFDEKTTAEQLERLKPGSAAVASDVVELSAGVPRNNTKLTGHVVGNPPNIPNKLAAVQSLLTDIKRGIEERFHPVVETICILLGFMPEDVWPLIETHPALVKKWDDSLFRKSFPELRQVQIGPGSLIHWEREKKHWVMDEPTRLLFERELRLRDEDLWRKLQATAYRMYKKWGKEYNSQSYKDKAAYHQQCLRAAGYDLGNEGEP